MNVLFLDYDGVVNIPLVNIKEGRKTISYNWPSDNMVNHKEALKFIELFCQRYDYKIVCSSSWRREKNYADCLYNAGLSKDVEVIGRTSVNGDKSRAERIYEWIESFHPEKYIVIDDNYIPEDEEMEKHFIQTDCCVGFMLEAYEDAVRIYNGWKVNFEEGIYHHHEDN